MTLNYTSNEKKINQQNCKEKFVEKSWMSFAQEQISWKQRAKINMPAQRFIS